MSSPIPNNKNDPDSCVPQLPGNITFGELAVAAKVLAAVASLSSQKINKSSPEKKKKDDNNKQQSAPKDQQSEKEKTVSQTEAVATLESVKEEEEGEEEKQEPEDLALYKHVHLRPLRKALAGCFELHQRCLYGGLTVAEYRARQRQSKEEAGQRQRAVREQRKRIAATALRQGRVDKLQKLLHQPDGAVETTPLLLKQEQPDQKELPLLRSCYVCKVRFAKLHHFYDQLCPDCAAQNWNKRHQTTTVDSSYVAVVTGARVKIGWHVALKLLRAGFTVIAVTRFPMAAAAAYRAVPDSDQWSARLQVYGLDLRDVTGLEAFTRFVQQKYGRVDVLINNACQTVRRPAGYFRQAVQKEQELFREATGETKELLRGCAEFERLRRRILQDQKRHEDTKGRAICDAGDGVNDITATSVMLPTVLPETTLAMEHDDTAATASPLQIETEQTSTTDMITTHQDDESVTTPFDSVGLSHSAAMSQMVVLEEDVGVPASILPPGMTDVNGQQLDLRESNSWLLKMGEVSTPELMECMFVNAIAPFVLNARLQPLMTTPEDRPDRYIINVSAMEGKFYRYKMPNHPHTNMAKAALNMLTRTSAEELAKKHRIYMNSVDTGWINDENPVAKATKIAETNHFQTPIDEIDAAARILDPVFTGINETERSPSYKHVYGKFLKDYRETEW